MQKILELLDRGSVNSTVTNAIINLFYDQPFFCSLSAMETTGIQKRDREDDEKLAEGIKRALAGGSLSPEMAVDTPYTRIFADRRTPEEIAADILRLIDRPEEPFSLALAGNSGTGKGTTTRQLCKMVPGAVVWSNGNVFRSIVFLLLENEGCGTAAGDIPDDYDFDPLFGQMELKFTRTGYDLLLHAPGCDYPVSEIKDSLLQESSISSLIPSVARHIQGDVIRFTSRTLAAFRRHGSSIIIEGRKTTLNFIPTDYRVELVLKDNIIIGQRRAAQKIASLLAAMPEETGNEEEIVNYIISHYR